MTKKALRQQIEVVLARHDKVGMHAVGRALVHLKNRQTEDEQRSEDTKHANGRGFQPVHAKIGTSMANFYERRGFLSPKQVAYWQAETLKVKKPRICRYAGQIVEEAVKKMENKEAEKLNAEVEGFDNDQLKRMGVQ